MQRRNAIVHVPDRIVSVENLLTREECVKLIEQAESAGFKPSPPSGGGHGQTGRAGARTSQFYVKPNQELADKLWKRVQPFLPKDLRSIKPVPYMNTITKGDEYTPVGVSNHMRYYKYDVGQCIPKHDDYRISRYRYDKQSDKVFLQMTFLTLLVYLNQDFLDGRTRFWTQYGTVDSEGHCRFMRENDNAEPDLQIAPQTGSGLISDHMVQHEGEPPRKGVKYILRTDIVHEKPVSAERASDVKFRKGEIYTDWERHFEPSCINYTE